MAAETVTPFCSCGQHGVTGLDDLLDMLAAGIGQEEASQRLWGTEAEKKPRPGSRWQSA